MSVTAPPAPSVGLPTVPVALRRMHEPALHDPVGLLDSTRDRILAGGDIAQAVDILSDGLWWMRAGLPEDKWKQVIALVRAHPLMGLMHENPFTRRAFVKPRGYAGDAPLIDLLYYGQAAAEAKDASPLGLALLARDTAAPAAAAVRERRDFMAELIDHVAEQDRRIEALQEQLRRVTGAPGTGHEAAKAGQLDPIAD